MSVLFFCNFPPPFTGQSIGNSINFQLVSQKLLTEKIDISVGTEKFRTSGKLEITRVVSILIFLWKLYWRFQNEPRPNVLYMAYSCTSLGVLRDYLCTQIAKRKGVSTIGHIHNGNYHQNFHRRSFSWLSHKIVSKTDLFLFGSKNLFSACEQYIPSAKVQIIHNTVDDAIRFSDDEIEQKLKRRHNSDQLDIVFISNMILEKGYQDLAMALNNIRGKIKFCGHFAGSWPSESDRVSFGNWVSNHALSEHVKIYGGIKERSRLKELYAMADIFVLPTYYPIEAQPFSIIEALNSATPVIATDHASIPEVLEDGKTGYLVEPRNPTQIAEHIVKLNDRQIWYEMARNSRHSFLSRFDRPIIRDKFVRIIKPFSTPV